MSRSIVVHGRADVLAVAELDTGVRVWVTGRLSATYREACEGRYSGRCGTWRRSAAGRPLPRWLPVVVAVDGR